MYLSACNLPETRASSSLAPDGNGDIPPSVPRNSLADGPQLSPRMLECLQWASQGKSSTDIGKLLEISPRTVDDYLTECRRRLGVRTRVQAIVRAIALGLIRSTPP